MAKNVGRLAKLENVLMDQIEKLNDDSIGEDKEATRLMVDRSKSIADLAKNMVEIQRLKLDCVKEMNNNGGLYENYLGITDGK